MSLYRGFGIIEVGNVWFLAFLEPNELPVIERCPCYRGVRKERLDCIKDGNNSELKASLNYEKDLYFTNNKLHYIAYK